jgi:hypothetical protein
MVGQHVVDLGGFSVLFGCLTNKEFKQMQSEQNKKSKKMRKPFSFFVPQKSPILEQGRNNFRISGCEAKSDWSSLLCEGLIEGTCWG